VLVFSAIRICQSGNGQAGHRGKKAAYLLNDIESTPAEVRQLAMSNRGIETRLFTDEQQAVDWLTNSCFQSCDEYKKDSCLVAGKKPRQLPVMC
jgi:hypothetical protein